ncbi:Alpha-mannosidase 2C1 [Branchiostoma belcheri]|nr:Alpha-mannosidase 2C1 [Branchiostoma belcheri]
MAVVAKNRRATLERVEKFISNIYFTDVNLRGRLYPKKAPVTSLHHHCTADRIRYGQAVSREFKPTQVGHSFGKTCDSPQTRDLQFTSYPRDVANRSWSTHWFKVELDIPEHWEGSEVRFIWDSGSEAMVWQDGEPIQGLSGDTYSRTDVILTKKLDKTQPHHITLYVEMAANGMFGAGQGTMISAPDPNRTFTLSRAELAVLDRDVYNLLMDFEVIIDMAKHISEETQRSYQALYTANQMVNVCEVRDKTTYAQAREIARNFMSQRNGDSQHTIHAMGHCHIDSAWLWPYAETIRKCGRSWASTVRLMEAYPQFTFTCSQAQQFAWVKQHYPTLYQKIQARVAEGQFIPVGGTWVEMDGNIPSGESFVRQFLFGQKFFKKDFGAYCKEFWLPDTFGYSAQLPQIMAGAGIHRFLTQKLSWSLVNKFPHHSFRWVGLDGTGVLSHFPPGDSYHLEGKVEDVSLKITCLKHLVTGRWQKRKLSGAQHHTFRWVGLDGTAVLSHFPPGDSYETEAKVEDHHMFYWEGLDGSRCLAHFPPADSYGTEAKTEDLLKTVKNHKDKGRVNSSVLLYGHGDGGGGPTEDMLERLKRLTDVDGLPRVVMSSPDKFFSKVEQEESSNLCTWVGELYLELHQGTFTTQAQIKKGNRQCEFLFHNIELMATLAWAATSGKDTGRYEYPCEPLAHMWRLFLLNQFHDVLPGSCIKAVVDDALQYYQEIQTSGCKLLGEATERLLSAKSSGRVAGAINTLSWDREELLEIPAGLASKMMIDSSVPQQELDDGTVLVCASCPSMGYAALEAPKSDLWPVSVSVDEHQGSVVLENGYISASIDYMGRVTSLGLLETGREAIAPGCLGNQFVLFDDVPLYWDAWDVMDYHLETRKPLTDVSQQVHITESGPLRAAVQVQIPISDVSYIKQTITLDTGSMELRFHTQVEWHENRKFLKVEFPLYVRTTEATYETAFGHLRRPTHQNTSWDWARYEVCGHKWADLSEYNFGVALVNDCKYGHCAQGNVIRLSLLKSPKAPDSEADMGHHTFTYAIMPHMGTFQDAGVIQAAYSLNQPLLPAQLRADPDSRSHSFFTVSNPAVILETVKKAEDLENAIVLRLYESCGGHGTTAVSSTLPITRVDRCNLLEEVDSSNALQWEGGSVQLSFTPFQIITLLAYL